MGKCGSGLTALRRGLIKGLNGDLGACARKCFLVFIKVGKMCSFVLEMPLSSSRGVSKWTPRSGGEIVLCGAQSVLSKAVFADGPVLLGFSALPCWTVPLKHVFATILSSYLPSLLPGSSPPMWPGAAPCPPSLSLLSSDVFGLWPHWLPFHSRGKTSQTRGSVGPWVQI